MNLPSINFKQFSPFGHDTEAHTDAQQYLQ